jgi:NhaP-type Na+/H+ or K+/H+ antiporter
MPVALTAVVIAVGLAAQVLAERLAVPGIIFLLLAGMALGPDGLDLVRPDVYGPGLRSIVALCVAVIVFEGGMLIDVRKLREHSRPVLGLVLVGVPFTTGAAAWLAHQLLGLAWPVALLFGALASVTGPTVIGPILARISLSGRLHATLEGESVLADAFGVLLAAAIFIATAGGDAVSQLGRSLLAGSLIGLVVPLVAIGLMRLLAPLPGALVRLGVLGTALAVYVAAEVVAHESGILAVAIAGIVTGTLELPYAHTIRQFKGDLTTLSLSLVFLLLAANLPLRGLVALGWPALALVLVLMAVVRPLAVTLSTLGSQLPLRERAFVAWLAPRGIVATSAASFFSLELAARQVPGGGELAQLVFLLVLVTVFIEGLGAPAMARLLGLIPPKTLIVGGDKRARLLAEALVEREEPVEVFDADLDNVHALLGRNLKARLCRHDDHQPLAKAGAHRAKALVVATPDDALNLEIARALRARFPRPALYARLNDEANRASFREDGIEIWPQLEASPPALPLSIWNAAVQPEAAAEIEVEAGTRTPLADLPLPAGCILIMVKRQGRTFVPDGRTALQPGDVATVVGEGPAVERARRLLAPAKRPSWRFRPSM